VTSRRVVIEEPVSLSLGRYLDDRAGLAEVLDAIDRLADDPRPAGSFHRGDYHRLRVGRYRVLYVVEGDLITVMRVDRRRPGD
jgi:mRNA interferase RelE/StbE